MRPRPLIIFAVIALALLALAGALTAKRDRSHGPPSLVSHQRDELPHPSAEFDLPMDDVMPMHKAVLVAAGRFDGRVVDIALTAPVPPEREAGVQLVYRIRMVTSHRDVVDIRMDAITGRFVEVRGADLGAARRGQTSKRGQKSKIEVDD